MVVRFAIYSNNLQILFFFLSVAIGCKVRRLNVFVKMMHICSYVLTAINAGKLFGYNFTWSLWTIIGDSKIKECDSKSLHVQLFFMYHTCMIVSLYIWWRLLFKVTCSCLHVLLLFSRNSRENLFHTCDKQTCGFVWEYQRNLTIIHL